MTIPYEILCASGIIKTPDSHRARLTAEGDFELEDDVEIDVCLEKKGCRENSWSVTVIMKNLKLVRDETFPVPLKYIDVVRQTKTEIDSVLECTINDLWIEDKDTDLSETWIDTTRLQNLSYTTS